MSETERERIVSEYSADATTWVATPMGDRLRRARAGGIVRPTPTVGTLTGAASGLFYPGKVSGIAGDSGSGKSWIALASARAEAISGRHTLWIDYEDNADTLAVRMSELDWPEALGDHVHHIQAEGSSAQGVATLRDDIARLSPALVVLDSTGESLAGDGRNPNADDDVAAWFQGLPRPLADLGPAVVLLDHLVKDSESGGLWPSGSQRKRAAVNGVQYIVKVGRPFSRDMAGSITLVCAKDRGGNYPQGEHVAVIEFQPVAGVLHITSSAGGIGSVRKVTRPTWLMERISVVIEESETGALSHRAIRGALTAARVSYQNDHTTWAIEVLIREGYLTKTAGPRNSSRHEMTKPYRADADPLDEYGEVVSDG